MKNKLLVDFIECGQNIDMYYHDMQFPGDRGEESNIYKTKETMYVLAKKLKEHYSIDVHTFEDKDFSYKESEKLTYTDENVVEASQWIGIIKIQNKLKQGDNNGK